MKRHKFELGWASGFAMAAALFSDSLKVLIVSCAVQILIVVALFATRGDDE